MEREEETARAASALVCCWAHFGGGAIAPTPLVFSILDHVQWLSLLSACFCKHHQLSALQRFLHLYQHWRDAHQLYRNILQRLVLRGSAEYGRLRIPVASKAARVGIHSVSIPCFCEISLPGFALETAPVPLITSTAAEPDPRNVAAVFYLDQASLKKLFAAKCFKSEAPCLRVVVYTGRQGSCCGVSEGNFLGNFSLPVEAEWDAAGRPLQLYDGWSSIGKKGGRPGAELHINVKLEADPRFIFQLDGETALSPQIVQIHGNSRQPIFSCKFSRDRSSRARLGFTETPATSWGSNERDRERKERKGWLVMIHDLSGSPVAAASIVTPFVPSSGSDYVSRSNPGAWLILRPNASGVDSWQPWGRLEAWREKGGKGGLGLRFQLASEGGITSVGSGILVSETVINTKLGGEFSIDTVRFRPEIPASSPAESAHSSGDCNFSAAGMPVVAGGFVMSCPVHGSGGGGGGGGGGSGGSGGSGGGGGGKRKNKGNIQMAVRHVTCVEDAAVFMALAAAADLSMEACQPFSKTLRKELSTDV